MRVFGTILILLAVASLIIGAATSVLLYSSGQRMYDKFLMAKGIVEDDIEQVRDAFEEVNRVFEDSRAVVDDYEMGRLTSTEDERVRKIFRRINEVLQRTKSVKDKSEADIELVKGLVAELTEESVGLIPAVVTCILSLVISGWLFGFGMFFRASGTPRT